MSEPTEHVRQHVTFMDLGTPNASMHIEWFCPEYPDDADPQILSQSAMQHAIEAIAAALSSPETTPAGGTTTDCPLEGVHEHPFRGPHRFHEWDPANFAPGTPTPAGVLDEAALAKDLETQWLAVHADHCDNRWPHPDHDCYWPQPASLAAALGRSGSEPGHDR